MSGQLQLPDLSWGMHMSGEAARSLEISGGMEFSLDALPTSGSSRTGGPPALRAAYNEVPVHIHLPGNAFCQKDV